jgi:hypothetical protein
MNFTEFEPSKDPRADRTVDRQREGVDTPVKLSFLISWLVLAFILIIIVWTLVWIFCGRSLRELDKFYAESHKLPQNAALIHKETTLGGIFTTLACYIIVAVILQSSLDFLINNTQERKSLILDSVNAVYSQNFNLSFNTTLVGTKPFCQTSQIIVSGFTGIPYINISSSSGVPSTCTIIWTCPSCNFIGNNPQVCIRYRDPSHPAFGSFIKYVFNSTSVITKPNNNNLNGISGDIIAPENRIFYGDFTTSIFVNIFRSEYIQIYGGLGASFAHMFDIIQPAKDSKFYGLFSFLDSISQGTTFASDVGTTNQGFNVCYNLVVSTPIYQIEEYTKVTLLSFLAQIAALTSGIANILGFVFTWFEFFWIFLKRKIRGYASKSEKNKGEELSEIEKMKEFANLQENRIANLTKGYTIVLNKLGMEKDVQLLSTAEEGLNTVKVEKGLPFDPLPVQNVQPLTIVDLEKDKELQDIPVDNNKDGEMPPPDNEVNNNNEVPPPQDGTSNPPPNDDFEGVGYNSHKKYE